jgi:Xaa-Pro aminopeptidase
MPVATWLRAALRTTDHDVNIAPVKRQQRLKIGADARSMSATLWLQFQRVLKAGSSGLRLTAKPTDNLVDRIWTANRPEVLTKDVFVHELRWSGETWQDKVERLRRKLRGDASASSGDNMPIWGIVVTEYDEVAWLFNLRGRIDSSLAAKWANSSLRHTPVFESQTLLTQSEIFLWLPGPALSDPHLAAHFNADSQPGCMTLNSSSACAVRLLNVSTGIEDLSRLLENGAATRPNGSRILVSTTSPYEPGASYAVLKAVGPAALLQVSPVLAMKAVKNKVEEAGMAAAHLRDALALCDWAARLEEEVMAGSSHWSEVSAARLLDEEYRGQQEFNVGISFRLATFTTVDKQNSCRKIF